MAYTKTTWANSPATTSPISEDNLNNIEDGLFDQDARITVNETNIANLNIGWNITGGGTYASATTITVPSGAALIYQKGDKIRYKQGGGWKYGYVVDIADTLLTVTGGSDYTVANTEITDMYVSHQENPIGFPSQFNFVSTFSRSGTAFTNPPTLNSAIFKITNNYVIGQIDFTMVASAGGTGEIYSTAPTDIVISAVDIGTEVVATAELFTLNAASSVNKINYYTVVSPAVIQTTAGYRYIGCFRYYI